MWNCVLVEDVVFKRGETPIGTMFYGPNKEEAEARDPKWNGYMRLQVEYLSQYYLDNNSHRRPLFVVLPNNDLFCVDGQCWSGGNHYGGWQVFGEAPSVTVSPSINIEGSYHGFLQNGVISDDCEGRTYDAEGWLNVPK